MEMNEIIKEAKALINQCENTRYNIEQKIIEILKANDGSFTLPNEELDGDSLFTVYGKHDVLNYVFAGVRLDEYDEIILLGFDIDDYFEEEEEEDNVDYTDNIESVNPGYYDRSELVNILSQLICHFSEK